MVYRYKGHRGKRKRDASCLPACLPVYVTKNPIHLMKSNSHALFYTVTSHTNNRNRIEPANATDHGLKKVQYQKLLSVNSWCTPIYKPGKLTFHSLRSLPVPFENLARSWDRECFVCAGCWSRGSLRSPPRKDGRSRRRTPCKSRWNQARFDVSILSIIHVIYYIHVPISKYITDAWAKEYKNVPF